MLKETGLGFGNRIVFLHPATVEVDISWRRTRKSLKHFAVSGECGVFENFHKKENSYHRIINSAHDNTSVFFPVNVHISFLIYIYIYLGRRIQSN